MERSLPRMLVCLLIMAARPAYAIDVTASSGSGDAATLAAVLVDGSSPITLNSANFLISLVGGGTVESEIRCIGLFTNGNAGGQLPAINQLDPQNPVSYAGGIGLSAGVCLCTGVVTDADSDGANAVAGSGVGVQGPNNGFPLTAFFDPPPVPGQTPLNAGEASFRANKPRDADFAAVKTVDANNEGDATVLQFQISVSAPGFLRISFVFASDEHPFWIVTQGLDTNDSMAVFVRKDSCGNAVFENIALLKAPGQPDGPMSLRELRDCGPKLFLSNQVAPAPDDDLIPTKQVFDFPTSQHGFDTNLDGFNRPDDAVPYYNHEFGGFSKVLTRETRRPLSPGTYTIKIVVQDVFDRKVDSAVFVESGSLKLFDLNPGDYDGDGIVDKTDYKVWREHFGLSPAGLYDGDGNGNCVVDGADYVVWRHNEGLTGNADLSADFNRDGCVDGDDFLNWQLFVGLAHCASRFEGDADGDGDVDNTDLGIWQGQVGNCSGGNAPLMAGNSGSSANDNTIPDSADVDGDGDVDEADLALLDKIIFGTEVPSDADGKAAGSTAGPPPEPTLADPQPSAGAPSE